MIDLSKIHFTSDPHFWHSKVIKFNNRPFEHSHHMNEVLIENWNNVVGEDHEVYLLGDVSWGSPRKTKEVIDRLNGKIYLIRGNHEKSAIGKQYTRDRFEWIKEKHELKIVDEDVKGGEVLITLCHYAMRVWNKSHFGHWMLYGHSHDGLDKNGFEWGRSMDAGVDAAYRILGEYRPFNYYEIRDIMINRDHKIVNYYFEIANLYLKENSLTYNEWVNKYKS